MIIVSLLAAGVLTIVSGLVSGPVAFVAARVLTGLGEGVFYSNDRTLIIRHTPAARRTLPLRDGQGGTCPSRGPDTGLTVRRRANGHVVPAAAERQHRVHHTERTNGRRTAPPRGDPT
jgi:hypothetical protein